MDERMGRGQRVIGNHGAVVVHEVHDVRSDIVLRTEGIPLPCMCVHIACDEQSMRIVVVVISEGWSECTSGSKVLHSAIIIGRVNGRDLKIQQVDQDELTSLVDVKSDAVGLGCDIIAEVEIR